MKKSSKSSVGHRETSLSTGPRGQPYMRYSGSSRLESSGAQSVVRRLVLVCKISVVPEEGRSLHQR